MHRLYRNTVFVALFGAAVIAAGCKKKIPPTPVATAPPAQAAPTASLAASPGTVLAGDKVVLTWNTTNASTISIDGLGTVAASGSKTLTPGSSTTYHLVARGGGGTADASAHVTVNSPAPATASSSMSEDEEFRANMKDVFFDYDKYSVRTEAEKTLSRDASYLASHPRVKVLIGGYCDERGSNEYNLALGQNRASSAEKALEDAGIAPNRIRVISYGKEKPFCSDPTETCYQKNRRAGFSLDNR